MWPLLFWHLWAMACHGMPLQSLCQAFATDQRAIDLLQRGKAGWIRIMTLENQKGNCNSNTIVYTVYIYRYIDYIDYIDYIVYRGPKLPKLPHEERLASFYVSEKPKKSLLVRSPSVGWGWNCRKTNIESRNQRVQRVRSGILDSWFRTRYVCESHHSNVGISSRFMKSCLLEELPIIEHAIISSIKSKWNHKIESSNSSWTWIIPSPISPIIFNFVQISGDCIEASTWEMRFPSMPLRRNIAFCGRVPKASLVTWQPMQVVAVFHPIEIWWTVIIEKKV